MWVNETVFSEGDLLSQQEEYDRFVKEEYGTYEERLEHVKNMIARLVAEQEHLESVIE